MTRPLTVLLLALIAHRLAGIRDRLDAAEYRREHPKRAVGGHATITTASPDVREQLNRALYRMGGAA